MVRALNPNISNGLRLARVNNNGCEGCEEEGGEVRAEEGGEEGHEEEGHQEEVSAPSRLLF